MAPLTIHLATVGGGLGRVSLPHCLKKFQMVRKRREEIDIWTSTGAGMNLNRCRICSIAGWVPPWNKGDYFCKVYLLRTLVTGAVLILHPEIPEHMGGFHFPEFPYVHTYQTHNFASKPIFKLPWSSTDCHTDSLTASWTRNCCVPSILVLVGSHLQFWFSLKL